MANLLYLVHRLPYPPNKGDKVRSFHLLKHLVARHRVHLGTFVDDPEDEQHVEALRSFCTSLHVERLSPRYARLRSLSGLVRDEPLTLPYYRSAALQAWVDQTIRVERLDAAVIFSSAMAQYVPKELGLRTLVDLVDVDSAKWTQYAGKHRWPLSWLYAREGRTLLAFERATVRRAAHSFLVTDAEVELFVGQAPECARRVDAVSNGVDSDFFSPDHDFKSPYTATDTPVVFTGAMDYWPNVDAVTWFATDVLPALVARFPSIRFTIVGMRPTPAVQALTGKHVVVTGTVADVRPYLAHAAVVVAPLRIARGVQNKVLEAMAMAKPVIASTACAGGIDAAPGTEFLTAGPAADYIEQVLALLGDSDRAAVIGAAARQRVLERYSWDARLALIDAYLDAMPAPATDSSLPGAGLSLAASLAGQPARTRA